MSSLRRNAIANVVGRVITAVLWVGATPFLLVQLGHERFGIWSLFFSFNAYLLWLDLGVGSTMLRFIAAQRHLDDRQALVKTLRRGQWAATGIGLAWMVAIAVSRSWIAEAFHVPPAMLPEALDAMLIFGISVMLVFPAQALMASLKGFERIDLSNLCMTVSVGIHVLVLCINLSAGLGLRGAAWAGVVGQIAAGSLAFIMVRSELLKVSPHGPGTGPAWRDLVNLSAAFQLLGVLVMLQLQAGRIVVGVLGNLTMVADYELAFRVSYVVAGLPILIREPVIPAVSRIWEQEGPARVAALFTSSSRWIFTYSAITLGLLWMLATDLTTVWLGPGYERIADLIRIWVIAYAANLAYSPGVAVARGMGMPRFEILSYAAAVITNVGLAIWWVPRYGVAGAVAAVAVSYYIGCLVFVGAFHAGARIFPFWPWLSRDLAPRVFAGLAAVALSGALLATPLLSNHLPPPGWTHGAVTALVFLTTLALLLLPLGDTQHLFGGFWQMTGGALARRRGTPSS